MKRDLDSVRDETYHQPIEWPASAPLVTAVRSADSGPAVFTKTSKKLVLFDTVPSPRVSVYAHYAAKSAKPKRVKGEGSLLARGNRSAEKRTRFVSRCHAPAT